MLKTGQILFLYTRCYQTLLSSNTLIRLNCIGSRTSCYSSIIQGISRLSAFNSRQPSVVLEKKRIFCSIPSSNSLNQQQQDSHLSPKDNGRYKIVTVPNFLCITRIGLTPLIGYLVIQHQYCPAFILFVIAGFTDLLDGFIARNIAGQKSLLGSVLDPMADKLLISCMFVTMTHAGLIPLPLTIVVILRDVCLIIGGFYKRYHSMDPPYSINRFFNPEVSSIQIVPTWMSKINTVLQLSLVAASLASPVFQFGVIGEKIITGLFGLLQSQLSTQDFNTRKEVHSKRYDNLLFK